MAGRAVASLKYFARRNSAPVQAFQNGRG